MRISHPNSQRYEHDVLLLRNSWTLSERNVWYDVCFFSCLMRQLSNLRTQQPSQRCSRKQWNGLQHDVRHGIERKHLPFILTSDLNCLQSSNMTAMVQYTQMMTAGSPMAAIWGANIDMSSMPESVYQNVLENVM